MARSSNRARAQRAAKPAAPTERCWLPPGETTRIGDWYLPDGMIYVGRRLPPPHGLDGQDIVLINPTLKLAAAPGRAS